MQRDKVESPAYHQARHGFGRYKNNLEALNLYDWSSCTVKDILKRPEYMGYTVNFRTTSKSYKEKKNIINTPDKRAVFENTQEAIVDSETWHLAQKLIGTPRRSDTIGEANPLTGLVFCADCGAKMYNHRSRPYTNQDGRKIPGFDGYDCTSSQPAELREAAVRTISQQKPCANWFYIPFVRSAVSPLQTERHL